jgi:hypothetical protein
MTEGLRIRKPIRLRLLAASAFLICALIGGFFTLLIVGSIRMRQLDAQSIFGSLLLLLPFLIHALLLLYVLRTQYPCREISKPIQISLIATTVITFILFVVVTYYFIDILSNYLSRRLFINTISNPIAAIIVFATALVYLLQLYNNVEGIRILRIIKKNLRQKLIDSF